MTERMWQAWTRAAIAGVVIGFVLGVLVASDDDPTEFDAIASEGGFG